MGNVINQLYRNMPLIIDEILFSKIKNIDFSKFQRLGSVVRQTHKKLLK
jgi:hypothetical protein